MDQTCLLLWSKSRDEKGHYHPLLYHLLDTAAVAEELAARPAGRPWVQTIAKGLSLPIGAAHGLVLFLVALHDIGKASPGFQILRLGNPHIAEDPEANQSSASLPKGPWPPPEPKHCHESFKMVEYVLGDVVGRAGDDKGERRVRRALAQAVGAHHGEFLSHAEVREPPSIPPVMDEAEEWQKPWVQARSGIIRTLRRWLDAPAAAVGLQPDNLAAACVVLNGLTVLSDWIASSSELFQPVGGADPEWYIGEARRRARAAVERRRLDGYVVVPGPVTFESLFPALSSPRPLQRSVQELEHTEACARLVVIEAPTGEGKTEAALLWAAKLWSDAVPNAQARGLYFALPTIATSRDIHRRRVKPFLQGITPEGSSVVLQLVNSQADIGEPDYARASATQTGEHDQDERVEMETWFLPRKRALLAPYAVGTVDQAMMAALNVRHVCLRLLGLAGKVLVIDEVHAYDLYMTTIIKRLVEWMSAVGTSVVMLSATLPSRKRRELVEACGGSLAAGESPSPDAYPLVTIVEADGRVRTLEPRAGPQRLPVRLEWRPDGEDHRHANAQALLDRIASGGCAAWICNTVREAQEGYLAVKTAAEVLPEADRPEVILFHARFLHDDRKRIEEQVVGKFGPDNGTLPRPHRAVVVATQVVEQSLDLDFDVLMTQFAPVDLLLQRAGRMHRHLDVRPSEKRPEGVRRPCMLLLQPKTAGGEAYFGPYGLIYEPFVLIKSLIALVGREEIGLQDVRDLVEAVYDDRVPDNDECAVIELDEAFVENALTRMIDRRRDMSSKAASVLLRTPDDDHVLDWDVAWTLDDHAEENELIAAQTRLGEPTVRLVVLDASDLLAATDGPLWGKERIGPENVRYLLGRSVSVSNRSLVAHLQSAAPPPAFRRCAPLRGYRLLVVQDGTCSWPGHTLLLHEELGIVIKRHEEV